MELSNKAIKEIAESLDCGMVCYVHKETKEVKSIIDTDNIYAVEELDEIENNRDKYLKVEKMSTREAFKIMENFADQVSNKDIRNRLIYALKRSKPFKNFKYEVDYNEEVRQQWFKFKAYKDEEWVKEYLEDAIDEENRDDEIPKSIGGYYDDDGNDYNPGLYPLPSLCMSCKKKNDPSEEIVCNLTRLDQLGAKEFRCFAYEKKGK